MAADALCRYGGLLLLAFGLSAATGSDVRFAASLALFYVLDRKANTLVKLQTLPAQSHVPLHRLCGLLHWLHWLLGVLQVELEEEALGKKYDEYTDYKQTAKRLIPYLY
jgi:protein-S-isoprenylcysteine O-methyltransferase Ste14